MPTDLHILRHAVAGGWTCLEIGAGGGSMARWLANRVRSRGKVVATDINTRFLCDIHVPNVEVRQHNVVLDHLEPGKFDLVHCRTVLVHLREREQAIERMAAAVRLGGWLFIEEPDYGLWGALTMEHPSAQLFNTTGASMFALLQKGGVDPYLGRRLRHLVETHNMTDVGHECTAAMLRGDDVIATFAMLTLQAVVQRMITAGLLTAEGYAEVERAAKDPTFAFVGSAWFGVWGRRV